jgi:hypothetical protein
MQSNEEILEDMNTVAHALIKNMILDGQDHSQLDRTVSQLNKLWAETRAYLDEFSRNLERGCLTRKVHEEIATLRDVHEGYHRYINTVEPIANDPDKLSFQLETNKVKLKGMNSYETRLNELKLLTNQLEDKELINEIEQFASKWTETYSLISKLFNLLL